MKRQRKITICYFQKLKNECQDEDEFSVSPREVLFDFAFHMEPFFFIDDETTQGVERERMWEMIKVRKVGVVAVPKINHLLPPGPAHSTDVFALWKFFDKHHVTLVSLKESFDTSSPLGRFNLVRFCQSLEEEEAYVTPCLENRMGNNSDLFPPIPGWGLN